MIEVLPLLLLLAAPKGPAPPEPRALRLPVRVTAGESNQLLGRLHPDGQRLFFMSDRDATTQIYVQDITQGGARLLWDADADVTTPRISPDGRTLLYVSYVRDATGDLCVMDLGEEGGRRCLSGSSGSESQPFWFPDGRTVGAVRRSSVHANVQLRRWSAGGGKGEGIVVLDRNLTAPALSPDGAWLAFVPLERSAEAVGVNFAQKADEAIEVLRLDAPERAIRFEPDLPGVSGYPAFSADGRWLYFAQYLNDTNFDGVTNGSDNAVIFRTPFDGGADPPLAPGVAQQLTSAAWNCQYPAPAKDRLVMTCARHGSLDVYTLPLAGSVPRGWDAARLEAEVAFSRDPWERLLLLGSLAARKGPATQRTEALRAIATLHMELGEYASAGFYARRAAMPGWSEAMVQLVEHRIDERLLNLGRMSRKFLDIQLGRLRALALLAEGTDGSAKALAIAGRAEIWASIGRAQEALEALDALDLATIDDPWVLRLIGGRPLEVLRPLGLRERRHEMMMALATHPAFDDAQRLAASHALIGDLERGGGVEDRRRRLDEWRTRADPDGELALLLDVRRLLLELPTDDSQALLKRLFKVYQRARSVVRRRAVTMAITVAAARHDDAHLLYQFINAFTGWVRRGHPERKHSERLLRDVVLEEAYLKWAEGAFSNARGSFFTVTLQTDSFEAHAGFVEGRRKEGKTDLEIRIEYDKRYKKRADRRSAVYRFVRAYIEHPGKPGLALKDVRAAAAQRPHAPEVQQMWGYLLQRRFHRTGERSIALRAYERYLLALDLARERPRTLAAVHQMAGLLQASVGNHRLALEHFERRLRWPFLSPASELSLRAPRARALFMTGRDAEAAVEADGVLELATRTPSLARFVPLLRDRRALYHYAAGDYDVAVRHYAEAPAGFRRDLMAASAALAAGQGDPEAVRAARRSLGRLRGAPARDRYHAGVEDYRLVLDGLEAEALAASGRPDLADGPVGRRMAGLVARRGADPETGLLLDLAAASFRRARYADEAGDPAKALAHTLAGLDRSDEYDALTGSPFNPVGLRLTVLAAELSLAKGASADHKDLAARVGRAYKALCERPNPRRGAERFILGLYLTMLGAQP